jgi:hypothetical protein
MGHDGGCCLDRPRRRRRRRRLLNVAMMTAVMIWITPPPYRFPPPFHCRPVSLRASVVIPLCNVHGVASILFERRSSIVKSFKNQVSGGGK